MMNDIVILLLERVIEFAVECQDSLDKGETAFECSECPAHVVCTNHNQGDVVKACRDSLEMYRRSES